MSSLKAFKVEDNNIAIILFFLYYFLIFIHLNCLDFYRIKGN